MNFKRCLLSLKIWNLKINYLKFKKVTFYSKNIISTQTYKQNIASVKFIIIFLHQFISSRNVMLPPIYNISFFHVLEENNYLKKNLKVGI